MRFSRATLCFLVLACIPAATQTASPAAAGGQQAQSKIDPAKEADIRKLMEISGAGTIARQLMARMTQDIKPLLASSLPPGEYREKLVDLFFAKFQTKAEIKEVLDLAIPVYDKYFSHEEIKGLIQFYQSPLGQKAITMLPKLMEEVGDAGRQWGQRLGRECMQEVLAEHPDLASALEEAGKQKP